MILFLSDVHLGRESTRTGSDAERDLISFLRSREDQVERLYFLGDVFDHFIEYRHLVPRGFARLQGLLAEWTDRGISVTYLVGNHDPWHEDYFEQELGIRVVHSAVVEPLLGRQVYMEHGDAAADRGVLRRLARSSLRHPIPVWLYKRLLPGDVGMFLARVSSRALRARGDWVKPEVVDALRHHARHILRTTPASVVVMGHSHHAELIRWPEGEYMNTGCWFRGRSFGRLDDEGLSLCRWDGLSVTRVAAPEAPLVS